MPEEPKGDKLWLVLSVATGVAVDVTLNKYSSLLPVWAVLCVWAVPTVLLLVWLWKAERTTGRIRSRFKESPFFYIFMALACVPIFWYSTKVLVSRIKGSGVSTAQPVRALIAPILPSNVRQGSANAPKRKTEQPPVANFGTQPSPATPSVSQQQAQSALPQNPYEEVKQAAHDVEMQDKNHVEELARIPVDSHRLFVILPTSQHDGPVSQELQSKWEKEEYEDTTARYLALNEQEDVWMVQKKDHFQAVHTTAINYMSHIKNWSPEAIADDQKAFDKAVALASNGTNYYKIETRDLNKDRFTVMRIYFDNLLKKVNSYYDEK
jgi:hypothetical protein